jgi:hypothetical protein
MGGVILRLVMVRFIFAALLLPAPLHLPALIITCEIMLVLMAAVVARYLRRGGLVECLLGSRVFLR